MEPDPSSRAYLAAAQLHRKQPLWTAWAQLTPRGGDQKWEGGDAEHAASILGGGYCSPPARVIAVFGFLPALSCLVRFILPVLSGHTRKRPQGGGGRGRRGELPAPPL